ncbi:hypothetical protein BJV77DRAFT_539051 [Russula vinacea]|nr:hypothetical protein BJV77DRAFT_539051 [Russula vinacea]
MYNSGVPSSQQYPSQQPPSLPPIPHADQHTQLDPHTNYPSYPDSARYASTNSSNMSPHMMQRTVSMPMPVHHQYPTRSVPHDGSPPNITHPPSHSEMWPQPTPQSWSHPDANEGGGDWDSDGEFEQSPEGASHLQKKSPPGHPFGLVKKQRERLTLYIIGVLLRRCSILTKRCPGKKPDKSPDKSFPSGSPLSIKIPCRYCRRMSPREIVERLGGFCCVEHRHQWIAEHQ